MTNFKYIVLLMMVMLLVGCGKKDPLQPTAVIPDHIMPLNVDNVWVYEMYFYNPGNPIPAESYFWTMTVTEDLVINNEKWCIVMHTVSTQAAPDDIDTLYYVFYANRDTGLWMKPGPADAAEFKTKYPANQGETFTGHSIEYFFPSSMTFGVVSTGTSVTVPAGNFDSYHYAASPSQTLVINDYYSPRVGLVRSDWVAYDSYQGWFTAVEFKLNRFTVH